MSTQMKRMLQVAAGCIVIGFLVMFAAFLVPEEWVDALFIIGGTFASIGALAAVSASIALVIKLLRE
ncbi:MAG: hypothetical protein AAGD96_35915 [Chloroflexota bacterium]